MGNFKKNDQAFVCAVCGAEVKELGYSSRNHCNHCLSSIHIDNNPGDRENPCGGIMEPMSVIKNRKGYVILFKCKKCGAIKRNIIAKDDNMSLVIDLTANNFKEKDTKKKGF